MAVFHRPRASGFAAGFLCCGRDSIRASLVALVLLTGALLTAEDIGPVATYGTGQVTPSEFQSWKNYRKATHTTQKKIPTKKGLVEELVILKVLALRFDAAGVEQSKARGARLDFQRWQMAEKLLRNQMVQASVPSDGELKAAFDANPGRYSRPRQWRLKNIFKRWPESNTEDSREQLHHRMLDLRRQILEGEDFGAMARLESDSQTRLRGGRLGLASLGELQPEVAQVVEKLEAGALSPVIETPDGLSLLRCTQILEAKSPAFEGVRGRLAKDLRRTRFKEAWATLDQGLIEDFRPTYQPEKMTAGAPDNTVVAILHEGESTKEISLAEYKVFLGRERVRQEAHTLGRERHLQFLRARILLEAHAHEATRRKLDTDQRYNERLAWKQLELKARMALDEMATPLIEIPTIKEIEALYTRRINDLLQEEKLHLRTLELPIRRDLPRAIYDQFEKLGERLAQGLINLDEAADQLEGHATVVDLGWKSPDEIWLLGRNVVDAVARLEPGGFSGPVQEGQTLRVFHLIARRKPRTPTLAEARPRLEVSLIAARRLKAEETIRRSILDEQEIEVTP